MNRLLRQIRFWRSSLSREGNIGIGLLGLSIISYFLVLAPAQLRLIQLQQDVISLSSRAHSVNKFERPTQTTASNELLTFYQFFPPSTSAPDWLQKIYTAAQKQHLILSKGKYRVKHQRTGSLIRYQIMLPITGNYRQVHEFIANVLTEIPNAALEGVSFERSKIGDTRVKANIKITLYLGQQT